MAPAALDTILQGLDRNECADLLVGAGTRDDAAVYRLAGADALIATTDFFLPVVDDPFDFGAIAAANAVSDVYAMGGRPILGLCILGWPTKELAPEVAAQVMAGAQSVAREAGFPIGGGHSVDTKEPLFGLAVNGLVPEKNLKTNAGAKPGDALFLTKPLGSGIFTTALKRGLLSPEQQVEVTDVMRALNKVGQVLGTLDGVHAMTDVTGFGLIGHLGELCAASGVSATVQMAKVPVLQGVEELVERGAVPGGSRRNRLHQKVTVEGITEGTWPLLYDPQTSGGLLIAAAPGARSEVVDALQQANCWAEEIGTCGSLGDTLITIHHGG